MHLKLPNVHAIEVSFSFLFFCLRLHNNLQKGVSSKECVYIYIYSRYIHQQLGSTYESTIAIFLRLVCLELKNK